MRCGISVSTLVPLLPDFPWRLRRSSDGEAGRRPSLKVVASTHNHERLAPEIHRVIYSTNAIESLNARFRRATRARGHFPNEQAALKCLYMVVRSLDPKGTGQERWMNRWKPALNAFAITFEGRLF